MLGAHSKTAFQQLGRAPAAQPQVCISSYRLLSHIHPGTFPHWTSRVLGSQSEAWTSVLTASWPCSGCSLGFDTSPRKRKQVLCVYDVGSFAIYLTALENVKGWYLCCLQVLSAATGAAPGQSQATPKPPE